MIGDNTYLIPLGLNITIMRHNIISLKLKYNHGSTEYRGIFSRYLPWSKISGTAQHYAMVAAKPCRTTQGFLCVLYVVIFVISLVLSHFKLSKP